MIGDWLRKWAGCIVRLILVSVVATGLHPEQSHGEGSLPAASWTQFGSQPPVGIAVDLDFLTQSLEITNPSDRGTEDEIQVGLGRLAFNTPWVLGGWASHNGLSCQACHNNGHSNPHFFLSRASAQPGTVNVFDPLFSEVPAEVNANATYLRIPSLYGLSGDTHFMHDGRHVTLEAAIHSVIVDEFAGAAPPAWLVQALKRYIDSLDLPTSSLVDETGRLAADAPAAVRRGESLFHRPLSAEASTACADCHQPASGFRSTNLHDIGTGGLRKTPSLRLSVPAIGYFHDARATDLEAVLSHYQDVFNVQWSLGERQAIAAYIAAVRAEIVDEPITLSAVVMRLHADMKLIKALLAQQRLPQVVFAIDALRYQLGQLHARFPAHRQSDSVIGLKTLSTSLRSARKNIMAGNWHVEETLWPAHETAFSLIANRLQKLHLQSLFQRQALLDYLSNIQ